MSRSNTLAVRIETHLQAKLAVLFEPVRAAASGDAAALHAMRVAARRLRVGLRYFAELFSANELRQVQRQLRRTTRILGKIRALDVNLQLLRPAVKYLPAGTAAVQRKLTGELLATRQQHLRDLRDLLQTFRTSQFESHIQTLVLQAWPRDNQRVRADAADVVAKLRRQLRRRYKNCRRAGEGGPEFHKLRVAAKRYRYALETSTAVFRASAPVQIAAIKKLQECLGTWHDLEELVEFLRGCRRKWKPADNPLAGRLTHVLTYFQGEQEVAFAEVKNLLREDPAWHKKVKLLLPHDESIALSRPADRG